jgi:hypothetical protein
VQEQQRTHKDAMHELSQTNTVRTNTSSSSVVTRSPHGFRAERVNRCTRPVGREPSLSCRHARMTDTGRQASPAPTTHSQPTVVVPPLAVKVRVPDALPALAEHEPCCCQHRKSTDYCGCCHRSVRPEKTFPRAPHGGSGESPHDDQIGMYDPCRRHPRIIASSTPPSSAAATRRKFPAAP